jgi:putative ABC transport system permease protein
MLGKSPGFTAMAVLALALGIGANSAIFSVVNTVLLRPLPYKDPDRLVMVWYHVPQKGLKQFSASPLDFIDWRDQSQVFEQMAAFDSLSFNLTGKEEPERIEGARVSASLFPLLGVKAALGRTFLAEEEQPGHERVVILSHGLWQRRFGADPGFIGQTLTLNGSSYTVVGILPASFKFPDKEELWTPLAFNPEQLIESARGGRSLLVIGRLKPAVTLRQGQTEMSTIARRLEQRYPVTNTGWGIHLVPLHEQEVEEYRLALLILLGVVGFVLLIACANVANLLLARAATRQKEIAIRTALGATRRHVIRQLLTESLLLAGLGGALGLLLALWGIDLLVAVCPADMPRVQEVRLDGHVLGFTLLVSLLAGVIFGLAPAFQASQPDLNQSLKEGGWKSRALPGRHRIRNLLVVGEVALALVLLIGAGLMIKSFLRVRSVHLGFNPEHVLTMQIALPPSQYAAGHPVSAFYRQLLARIEELPGVQSVGAVTVLPLSGDVSATSFTIEGRPPLPTGEFLLANYRAISPHYFRTMGIPLLQGRDVAERDGEAAPTVVVINQTMAQRFWPGEQPLGKRLRLKVKGQQISCEIVGVVGDVKYAELNAKATPEIYWPYAQNLRPGYTSNMTLVVRTASDPVSMAAAVRSQVQAVDRNQPVFNIKTMEQYVVQAVASWRGATLLLSLFAALALVLAAVGIYSVMSYSVTQRTHEIGVRMALGAEPRDVLRLVVGQGMMLTLIGVIAGLAAAFALTRVMSEMLYGVSPTDPTTFAAIALLLAAVALMASYIPARRATKVDPMVALRYE